MSEEEKAAPARPRLIRLHCNRTGQLLELSEHERCPYCFGPRQAIEQGAHRTFCDYVPGKDPVVFGFPDGAMRQEHG